MGNEEKKEDAVLPKADKNENTANEAKEENEPSKSLSSVSGKDIAQESTQDELSKQSSSEKTMDDAKIDNVDQMELNNQDVAIANDDGDDEFLADDVHIDGLSMEE